MKLKSDNTVVYNVAWIHICMFVLYKDQLISQLIILLLELNSMHMHGIKFNSTIVSPQQHKQASVQCSLNKLLVFMMWKVATAERQLNMCIYAVGCLMTKSLFQCRLPVLSITAPIENKNTQNCICIPAPFQTCHVRPLEKHSQCHNTQTSPSHNEQRLPTNKTHQLVKSLV